jgi:hypothetical protein
MLTRWVENRHHGCCHCNGVFRDEQIVSPVMLQQKDGWLGLSLIDIAGDVDNRLVLQRFSAKSESIGLLCCCCFMENEEWRASHFRW